MGRYDDITPEELRADLVAFARLILRLDREDGVLVSPADLQKLLGELRQKLFAYEVRASSLARESDGTNAEPADRGGPVDPGEARLRHSRKVVREALRRSEDMVREWDGTDADELEDED